jgi:Flp pilus assembly protein TadG
MTRRTSRQRSARQLARREHGAVSVYFVGLSVMLFVLAGLVIDGGSAINARQRAADEAEQAARTGANQIVEESLRASGGRQEIDEDRARAAIAAYMSSTGDYADPVVVGPQEIQVTVHSRTRSSLLHLIGVSSFEVSATATARAVQGIDTPTEVAP